MTQYDEIAKKYANTQSKRLTRNYIYDPSLFKLLGNLKGKTVLELACGDGRLTRQIKQLGAKEVIGIDSCKEMIDLAKEIEEKELLGIKYKIGKVGKLGKIGAFDLVIAGFLLHYSSTKNELLKMTKDIYLNLKKEGRFITLNNHPEHPLTNLKILGRTMEQVETEGELIEGARLRVTLWEGEEKACSFETFFWKKETYEEAFRKAGLNKVKWINVKVNQEGINKFGKEFWKDYYGRDNVIFIEASKEIS